MEGVVLGSTLLLVAVVERTSKSVRLARRTIMCDNGVELSIRLYQSWKMLVLRMCARPPMET